MIPLDPVVRIISHNHQDWSCNITDQSTFERRALSIFPVKWKDYGPHYEVFLIGIATRKSLTSKEVTEHIRDSKEVLNVSLIEEIELPKKLLFKAKVSSKHHKQDKDVLKVASKHRVPVRFICFSEGHETFSICSRKHRRVSNFMEDLGKIGTFSKLRYDNPSFFGDHLDYYYYCLLNSLGITSQLDIKIFNAIRSLITVNGSFSKSCLEPYARELNISSASMVRRFWNVCWQVVPAITSMNMLDTNLKLSGPCPYIGNQTARYIC